MDISVRMVSVFARKLNRIAYCIAGVESERVMNKVDWQKRSAFWSKSCSRELLLKAEKVIV